MTFVGRRFPDLRMAWIILPSLLSSSVSAHDSFLPHVAHTFSAIPLWLVLLGLFCLLLLSLRIVESTKAVSNKYCKIN